jgi:menaquinol-cytochrome c reductase iron-sulfur subunit
MTTPINPSGPQVAVSAADEPPSNRRSFFTAAAAVLTGTIAVLTPFGVGVAAFLTPLFRKSQSSTVRVALLDQVPDDGQPRSFPVIANRDDAWTRYPSQRIGAVYLIRNKGEAKPAAFTAKCPHAGCFIGYAPGDQLFKCPCHTSTFKLDGTRLHGDAEVAPRDMDPLPVEIRQQKTPDGKELAAVWVEFVDFQTGHKERIPTT